MVNLVLYVVFAILVGGVVIRLVADVRRIRLERQGASKRCEPSIDAAVEYDHFTDNYYQPAESTDEPVEWLAHHYKRDPVIWDHQDGGFYDNPTNREFSIRIRRKIRMRYIDRDGQATLRTIDTLRLGETPLGEPLLLGYCHTFMRNLAFRTASASECVDLDTGLRVADLESFLRTEYKVSAQATCDSVFAEYSDLFMVLNFVAQHRAASEQAVLILMTDLCRELGGDDRVSTTMVGKAINALAELKAADYEVAVSRFTQIVLPIDLERYAAKVIDKMAKPGSHSIEAKAYIKRRVRQPVPL